MPDAKQKLNTEPRIFHRREIAALLNCGETWLAKNMEKFKAGGMPPFDSLLNGWDARAIHRWIDGRSANPPPEIEEKSK